MRLGNVASELFIPDGTPETDALARTTHMGIVAHPDDLEMACFDGILKCFGKQDQWFAGVVVTDGAGSPRADLYANYTDEQMVQVRAAEQKKAAVIGEYGAQALLGYTSAAVKDVKSRVVIEDLKQLLEVARPEIVYTHNPADKHDTHVAVALRLIQALRELPADMRPKACYGCECWRDLDWLCDADKIVFDVSAHENLAAALLGVFDSQICGGKRYDLAALGRRRAHATMLASHAADAATAIIFALDLTPLINDATLNISDYVNSHITRFAAEVQERLKKLQ
jgi:LmbE family N-acetylglucosaminyl deacetylase